MRLPAESVRFQATDGASLAGWLIRADPKRPWLILCDSPQHARAELLELAAALAKAGFNLFLIDFRGHGQSSRHAISYGWLERHDLQGGLVFLGSRPDIPDRPYGLIGRWAAAITSAIVAARDDRLGAIVLRDPATDPLEPLLARTAELMRIPAFLHPLAALIYRLRFGRWPGRLSLTNYLAKLTDRPVLIQRNPTIESAPQASPTLPSKLPATEISKLVTFLNNHLTL
ncbi:MAG: hypothetical protein HYZ92_04085 [Candidatus Omnitrophica bacterium]|nr:hypothetical protein [Candidatus Omnitrophota bacterium]